jgi:cinnamyl-alcohol dehydrogenase
MQSESVLHFDNVENFVSKPIPAPQSDEDTCAAWGIHGVNQDFKPLTINRHKVQANDVRVDMLYCGICYTDVAVALN